MGLIACWHVTSEKRLMSNLRCGVCDHYPLGDQAEWWFDEKMGLSIGKPVRFCCKGKIVAEGIIASRPRNRTKEDPPILNKRYPSVVTIKDVKIRSGNEFCRYFKNDSGEGSHPAMELNNPWSEPLKSSISGEAQQISDHDGSSGLIDALQQKAKGKSVDVRLDI